MSIMTVRETVSLRTPKIIGAKFKYKIENQGCPV